MKKNIIVLDDDKMSLRSLENALREWDYNPVCFEELDWNFFSCDFSNSLCCIIDFQLKLIDGISVIKYLKRSFPNLICVLISGYSIDETMILENEYLINCFMSKPLNIKELNQFLFKINKEEE